MLLTSKTNLKLTKRQFEIIDEMSFNVKNLYNTALWQTKLHYENTNTFIGYSDLDKLLKKLKDHEDKIIYKLLPSQIAQQTVKKFDQNYKSFFKLLRMKNSSEYDANISTPRFLPKDGRKELILAKQSFSIIKNYIYIQVSPKYKKDFLGINGNKGRMKLCKLPEYLSDFNIKYLEIIPGSNSQYSLHIVYENNIEMIESNNEIKNWFSIDLGLNNLCAVSSNVCKAFLINGRHLKSINQKFNKRISQLTSIHYKQNQEILKKGKGFNLKPTKQIQQLWSRRNNKINSEIHSISNFIINSTIHHKIDTIVIGYNPDWKRNINLSKVNNQNFVQIPFVKIIEHLKYKAQKYGIKILIQEESYTSKTSFFDLEEVKKPDNSQTYKGKRTHRGLFKTSTGKLINADINGSLNIFRKALNSQKVTKVAQDVLLKEPLDTGLVMNPVRINLKTNLSSKDLFLQIENLKYFNVN